MDELKEFIVTGYAVLPTFVGITTESIENFAVLNVIMLILMVFSLVFISSDK